MAYPSCQICAKKFYVKPYHLKKGWGKFCSKTCQFKSQFTGKIIKCDTCDKEVYKPLKEWERSKSGKYFCSRSCQTIWRNKVFSGEKHANWLTGKSVYRSMLLKTSKATICLLCNISDIRVLNAHHKDHDKTNNSLDNLVWLCLNCHYLVHHSSELDEKMRK